MTNFTPSLAIVSVIDAHGSGIPRLSTAINDAGHLAEAITQACT